MKNIKIKKTFSFLSAFLFFVIFSTSLVFSNENDKNKSEGSVIKNFIYKYILPDKNAIFQDKRNQFYFSYNVSFNDASMDAFNNENAFSRKIHNFKFHYAQPDKFFRVHGRLSLGLFTLHGVGGDYSKLYHAYGIELIQELIFGIPLFYITAGIGPSFAMGNLGQVEYTDRGMTGFNFSTVIKIGHRFDCGVVMELAYQHYSNGGLGVVNMGVDLIGASIGYVF